MDANYFFASSDDDPEGFKVMFPDHKLQLHFGIASYVKELLLFDVANKPFSFKLSNNNNKVQKQYDAYSQYWLRKENLVQSCYWGSLFVGHCKIEDLKHFKHFILEMS